MPKTKTAKKTKKAAPKKTATKRQPKFVPFNQENLLTLKGVVAEDINALFNLTDQIKKNPSKHSSALKGKTLGLLFQKQSTRTRVSFEVAMSQLGGQAVYLSDDQVQLGEREPVKDVARTLSRYFDAMVLRAHSHSTLEEFSEIATVPVINGLTNLAHPCQALSDLYTIYSKYNKLKGINVTYIGDANNVLNSLIYGSAICGVNLSIVTPRGYEPSEDLLRDIKLLCKESGAKISMSNNPFTSLKNAHVIYTDVWVSMGQEKQRDQRLRDFQSFQVNQTIVSKALPDAVVMHCLPAHRGEEITDEVIEGAHSIVFEQAENKMHVQKALLSYFLTR